MIKPTVGRVVLFHPSYIDAEVAAHCGIDGKVTHAAMITHVYSDTCVNLAVFDSNGVPYSRTSVQLIQDDEQPSGASYAEWMPYQKQVATGHIQPTLHATEEKAAS